MDSVIPPNWLSPVKMRGIVLHWTAGAHKASEFDRAHYHILIESDGKLVRGIPPISANALPIKSNYAAHTRNLNGGYIGVSLCCMGGDKVRENPFNAGPYPMTEAQWNAMVQVIAQLCAHYSIPITPKTVLSHAEVQGTLGIAQAGKWDFTRLAFDPSIKGARAIGDRFRSEAEALMPQFAGVSLLSPDRDDVGHEYQDATTLENPPVMEETVQTNRQDVEPLSGFRKVLGYVTAGAAAIGSIGTGFLNKLAMLDYRVWVAVVVTTAFFGTIIFALIWLFPRPIVIEKEKAK